MTHPQNLGVGASVMTGYKKAISDGCIIAVKIDGDGQMNPQNALKLIKPIQQGLCDYTKGNRFFSPRMIRSMPLHRIIGNAGLSFLSKFSTGYWKIMDPTNGFSAIHLSVFELIKEEKIAHRFFFETDLLFRLNTVQAVVLDVPMKAVYGNEQSNLCATTVMFPFLFGHIRNTLKRIFYNYYLRNFSVASFEWVLGPALLLFGSIFGTYHWLQSTLTQTSTPTGTIMVAVLSVIVGLQLLLSAINFDINSQPEQALHLLIDSPT